MTGSTGSTTFVLVAVLVALGLTMIVLAIWLVRSTRSDAPALGPLEAMGDRSWRRADALRRQETLAEARPAGAPPPAPTIPVDESAPEVRAEPGPVAASVSEGEGEGEGDPTPHPESEPGSEPEPEPQAAAEPTPEPEPEAAAEDESPSAAQPESEPEPTE
jgi:hypothetical protein